MPGNQGRVELQGPSVSSPGWVCSRSAPGPSLPTLHSWPRPLPRGYGFFPQEAQGCSKHYLGQVLLEGLQGEDHGGSYSPVIMPGETEQGVRATVATEP